MEKIKQQKKRAEMREYELEKKREKYSQVNLNIKQVVKDRTAKQEKLELMI